MIIGTYLFKDLMSHKSAVTTFATIVLLAAMTPLASAQTADPTTKPGEIVSELALDTKAFDTEHLRASRMGYMPASVAFVEEKPAAIVKEPTYLGTPKYGGIRVGNGPRNLTFIAIDEPEGKIGKLYVDVNQNGDLTDDGPGDWEKNYVVDGVQKYMTTFTVHVSWGTPLTEQLGGDYSLMMYKNHGAKTGGYTTHTGRTGSLALGDKTYPIALHEGTNDGLFTVPATGDVTRRPVELCIDLDGDGTFKGVIKDVDGKSMKYAERFFLGEPIQIDEKWYTARPNISGRRLVLAPTAAPGSNVAAASGPKEFTKMPEVGSVAPAFTAKTPDDKPISLADFKGKIVILDFWATWCGPCQASMPGLEKLYQSVKDQDVVVLSLNVWDAKEPFDAWITKNSGTKYNFTFAFDALGREPGNIAAAKYGVTGIPTMFIIDREGKIAAAFVGGGKDDAIEKALADQGIRAKAE